MESGPGPAILYFGLRFDTYPEETMETTPVCPRDGVEVDLCGACRGIWLDRGELEKVDAYLRAEHPRHHPESEASAEDFGVLGGMVESHADKWRYDPDGDAEIARELWDVLRRVFGR